MQLKEREDYMQRDQNQETVEREGLVGERERIGKWEMGNEKGKKLGNLKPETKRGNWPVSEKEKTEIGGNGGKRNNAHAYRLNQFRPQRVGRRWQHQLSILDGNRNFTVAASEKSRVPSLKEISDELDGRSEGIATSRSQSLHRIRNGSELALHGVDHGWRWACNMHWDRDLQHTRSIIRLTSSNL
ncbi:hypothetical protein TIFTF001_011738 [Ficus carica]|uniref:Uncharacterized protein n=1 Tax=Ficus carica TaxID=3494 RepID=A0AA88AMA4_FICCA|nr:hypothetical protein TIFTF001_011738 [Ficus carica]